ncbi:unnamed protein product [Effrenium voratum]|nr:unnamed protein product [Effrenium voratum]
MASPAVPPDMQCCTVRRCKLSGSVPLAGRQLEDHVLEAYLARLQLPRPHRPDLAALDALLGAHVDRVAYENLDVQLNRAVPPLCWRLSAERVALKRRGGYCFLLVDAFASLLCSLGFSVSLHTATCGPAPEPEAKWGDHVVAVVHLPEGQYVADVGLGEGPRNPFKLEPAAWKEDGFEFTLALRPGGEWRFENPVDATGNLAGFAFDVSTSAEGFDDFRNFHEFFWTNKDSIYVKGPLFLHRKTFGRGILSLFACTLRRSHPDLPGGKEILQTAGSKEEWFGIVEEVFFMTLEDMNEDERNLLWEIALAQHAQHTKAEK